MNLPEFDQNWCVAGFRLRQILLPTARAVAIVFLSHAEVGGDLEKGSLDAIPQQWNMLHVWILFEFAQDCLRACVASGPGPQ